MGQSDNIRLKEINTLLFNLYIQLNQLHADDQARQSVNKEILELEREKEQLPTKLLNDDKIEQYVTILRSAASSLQLQRQNLHQFSAKRSADLSTDEIRHYQIWQTKLNTFQQKIDTYREKLINNGLPSHEIDNIILDGYREQNQRFLQKLLRSLQASVQEYVAEYYEQYGEFPDDIVVTAKTWEDSEKRRTLTYSQLRIVDSVSDCTKAGIPYNEIADSIKSASVWDHDKSQDHYRKSILASLKGRFRRQS